MIESEILIVLTPKPATAHVPDHLQSNSQPRNLFSSNSLLGLPNGHFTAGFPTKILYAFFVPPVGPTRKARRN